MKTWEAKMPDQSRSHSKAEVLGVYLEPTNEKSIRVGSLTCDEEQNVRFVVDQAYMDRGPDREILSSGWSFPGDEERTIARLNDTVDKVGRLGALPPWFKNVIPEGPLRGIVEQQLGQGIHTDFDILKRVGGDLPGAVVVRNEGYADVPQEASGDEMPTIRFGLAGVQLKLSVLKRGEGLTVPAEGAHGSIIAKLPSRTRGLEFLPELEFSAMRMAAAVGVDVAECDLMPISKLEGVGREHLAHGDYLLAVQRFDRSADGVRIHIEDMAQVFAAVDNQKYTKGNEETLLNAIRRFSSDPMADLIEACRRFVVDVLLGNGDAHLKNTSLIYKDGVNARLSKAYDIVSTFCLDRDDSLALPFGGTTRMSAVTLKTFKRPADLLGVDARILTDVVRQTIERSADVWPNLVDGLPMLERHREIFQRRWEGLALTETRRGVFIGRPMSTS